MSDNTAIEWADASWNPVRGQHARHTCARISPGCDNCLAPTTPVLYADMVWRPIGDAQVGDVLVGFDENPVGATRSFRPAVVEAVWWSKRRRWWIETDSTEMQATREHRWLRYGAPNWPRTDRLRFAGGLLRGVGLWSQVEDEDYRAGYLTGMTIGDGTFRFAPGQRSDKLGVPQAYWRVALADAEPLGRLVSYLAAFGVAAQTRPFSAATERRQEMGKVEVRSITKLATIHGLLTNERPSVAYARGFVAGFFDAEGSHDGSLRVSQKDRSVLDRFQRYAALAGFTFTIETWPGERVHTARLIGSVKDRMRFLGECQPAILRKYGDVFDRRMDLDPEPVKQVRISGQGDVVDIQTSTGTFFAGGVATHNCYAATMTRRGLMGTAPIDYGRGETPNDPARLDLTALLQPLRWRKPRRVFVCSMTDLFGAWVPDAWIVRIFGVMLLARRHTFIVLTKRPTRMHDLLRAWETRDLKRGAIDALLPGQIDTGINNIASRLLAEHQETLRQLAEPVLPNVWAGVSIESNRFTWRAGVLREVPAAVRWISAEPLLGPLPSLDLNGIDWLVAGSESGPGARPCDLDWVRELRDHCQRTGTAFFWKQHVEGKTRLSTPELDGRVWTEFPAITA